MLSVRGHAFVTFKFTSRRSANLTEIKDSQNLWYPWFASVDQLFPQTQIWRAVVDGDMPYNCAFDIVCPT